VDLPPIGPSGLVLWVWTYTLGLMTECVLLYVWTNTFAFIIIFFYKEEKKTGELKPMCVFVSTMQVYYFYHFTCVLEYNSTQNGKKIQQY